MQRPFEKEVARAIAVLSFTTITISGFKDFYRLTNDKNRQTKYMILNLGLKTVNPYINSGKFVLDEIHV